MLSMPAAAMPRGDPEVPPLDIRPIDPGSQAEVDLVAHRMRLTLIEVEGEATGTALYTIDWLRDRVRFHLDGAQCTGTVLLAEGRAGEVVGHTILRREQHEDGRAFGLVATTYVDPAWRRRGIAERLLDAGEAWFRGQGLAEFATWTSATNAPLVGLYRRHGYEITAEHIHDVTATRMVRLTRTEP